MDIAAKKLELMDWLLKLKDETKIKKILAFKTILDNDTVIHTAKGYPVDKEEYIQMVKEADERISLGNFTTIEELENEIENW
ncbi:hypothetical protein [Flavobacterium faecale]|uniref:hypothetical protein n=1 Tax=Flavobacterium faecale TaxID=1355330 RepID=UPI003AAE481B